MEENNYREVDAINYSLLKNVATNPKEIIDKKDISDNPSVKQGDLLDIRMQGEEMFAEKYAYFSGEIPTATLLKLAEKTIGYCKQENIELSHDLVLQICRANNFWGTFKDDTVISKFNNDVFWNYVKFNINNYGKLIIDSTLYNNVETAADTIKTHEFTTEIFDREHVYQKDIYFEFKIKENKKEKFKILPDIITFDHKNKIIFPYDFKFMSGKSVYGFVFKFFIMYYYIQAALYTQGIKIWAKENYPDYNVFAYQFIVISDTNLSLPLIFNPINYLSLGFKGFKKNDKDYPGIIQLVDDYHWHLENNLWEHRREIYENKGKIKIE